MLSRESDGATSGFDRASPLRRQYLEIKEQNPEAIVLFRLGDFYETFDDDARTASAVLEITLTGRDMGKSGRVPMAGVPAHSLEVYLARLVKHGYKVAICEQVSDATTGPGLVDRRVVRIVTPGTVIEPSLLNEKANNYIAAIIVKGDEAGLAYADITTAEFTTAQLLLPSLALELERLTPAEVIVPQGLDIDTILGGTRDTSGNLHGPSVTALEPNLLSSDTARRNLLEHFHVGTLEAFGCENLPLATQAAGGLLGYLQDTQKDTIVHLTSFNTYTPERYMNLDPQTRRNLELFNAGRFGGGTALIDILDQTRTPMGGRLLRRWLGQPLLDKVELERRLDVVDWLHTSSTRREETSKLLASISDLERLMNRIYSGVALPRELVTLRHSLDAIPGLVRLLSEGEEATQWLCDITVPCEEVANIIAQAISDEAGTLGSQAVSIRHGFSAELDDLRVTSLNAKNYVAGLERQERIRSGINTLKVGYNKIFGYFLEVSNSHLGKVPNEYIRRQTLVNAERFITPELKEYESLILNAGERLAELENTLFREVCKKVSDKGEEILKTATAVAQVDVFYSLAEVASRHSYVRPILTEDGAMAVHGGRHPVVERVIPSGTFVPNDITLGGDGASLLMLTGPNMAGKSTFIRQVALISLMAQIGCFVPAEFARLSLVDRIFTRVGLQDDLATGQSTFMVEMVETAAILHHATPKSLVILDEIGRGTSTYDGLAIARAVAEYLHSHPRLGCKTLFATHYHELTTLAEYLPKVINYNVSVVEENGHVTFLHRIVLGGADKSYGVYVGRLAGLPQPVVKRAWELLNELEAGGSQGGITARAQLTDGPQLLLWPSDAAVFIEELRKLDIADLTPLEAINKLYELQQHATTDEVPEDD
ncbi:MAG: DNA mismatch repair protein MutS [Chloroflexota bacterium]|nr:DNA mismatch repair protein MutS [Chloroflexota bacterium]